MQMAQYSANVRNDYPNQQAAGRNFVNTLTEKPGKPGRCWGCWKARMQNTGLLMEKQGEFYKDQMDLWMGMLGAAR